MNNLIEMNGMYTIHNFENPSDHELKQCIEISEVILNDSGKRIDIEIEINIIPIIQVTLRIAQVSEI